MLNKFLYIMWRPKIQTFKKFFLLFYSEKKNNKATTCKVKKIKYKSYTCGPSLMQQDSQRLCNQGQPGKGLKHFQETEFCFREILGTSEEPEVRLMMRGVGVMVNNESQLCFIMAGVSVVSIHSWCSYCGEPKGLTSGFLGLFGDPDSIALDEWLPMF